MKMGLNRKGQGTTEYIVILGIILVIAFAVMRNRLITKLNTGVDNIGNKVVEATR